MFARADALIEESTLRGIARQRECGAEVLARNVVLVDRHHILRRLSRADAPTTIRTASPRSMCAYKVEFKAVERILKIRIRK